MASELNWHVRHDDEIWEDADGIGNWIANCSSAEIAKQIVDAMNTRPAPAATDTRLVTVKWPYQKTFNAIGAAVKIQGDAKAISVQAFIEAFGDELVTRSQAVELLAENSELKKDRRFKQHVIDGLVVEKENLKADNAAQAARIKETEDCYLRLCKAIGVTATNAAPIDASEKLRALEAKLAAAEKALDAIAGYTDRPSGEWRAAHPELAEAIEQAKPGYSPIIQAISAFARTTLETRHV